MNKFICLFIFLFASKALTAEFVLNDSVVKIQPEKSWKIFKNYLDFSLVLVSPMVNNKRSTIGILEFKKTNLEKFYGNPKYNEDLRSQKEKWLKENDGNLESFHVYTESRDSSSRKIFDFSYFLGGAHFREKMSYYKCGDSTIQVKMVIPQPGEEFARDANLVMDSFSCTVKGGTK